ncbi:MAG: outer membrane beta-barrel protein [bacterium]|nr:outer membrane beta-barrel protein [bacterium]
MVLILLFIHAVRVEAEKADPTFELTASAEYDDNVTLVSEAGRAAESDLVFRLRPVIGVTLPHRDHKLLLSLSGDYRKGTDTDTEDLNFTGTAGIELNFSNGLQLNLADTYTQTSFDQELQEETGTPDSEGNALRAGVSYIPVDRLRISATLEQQETDFEEGQGVSAADRDTDTVEISVAIPITRSIISTISYTSEELVSPQRPDRDYTDESYMVSFRWEGPERFAVWFDLGDEVIDFADPGQSDFDDSTATIGTEVKVTEFLSGSASIGQDGFGELTYDGSLSYQNDTDRQMNLTFGQDTSPSFSFVFQSRVVQTSRIDLSLTDKLAERFTVTLGAGYQTQESFLAEEDREDEVFSGRFTVDYPVQDWLKLGFSYQYSRRTSSLETFDFTNNRIGLFGTLTY